MSIKGEYEAVAKEIGELALDQSHQTTFDKDCGDVGQMLAQIQYHQMNVTEAAAPGRGNSRDQLRESLVELGTHVFEWIALLDYGRTVRQ